jgi:hypothetical protein
VIDPHLDDRQFAMLDGAMNLLTKAAKRDGDAADRLIARAGAMPYEPRLEGSPGIRGAQQLVFTLVSDRFEESDFGEIAWLTAAIAAHARLDAVAQADLASTVHGFVLQAEFFETSEDEKRLILANFADAPLEVDLGDGPDLGVEERTSIIRSLVESLRVLEEEYQRTG